jgi:hypothetical protein
MRPILPIPAVTAARRWLGERLSAYLSERIHAPSTSGPTDPVMLLACLKPGDVVLVEGQTRVSVAIKYLTQSTWSHAALYAGPCLDGGDTRGLPLCFLEADLQEGVRAVSVDAFAGMQCRICRPVGLAPDEVDAVISFVLRVRPPPVALDGWARRPDVPPAGDWAGQPGTSQAG